MKWRAAVKRVVLLPMLALCAVGIGACRLNYGANVEVSQIQKEIPDMIARNTDFSVVRDAKLIMKMHADSAKIFNTAGLRVLEGVHFEEFDSEGKQVATGIATKATQTVQTQNVAFEGGLEVYLTEQEATIKADALTWNSDDKTLTGDPQQEVTVIKKDGSKIEGTGFFADLSARQVELSGSVDGFMVDKDSR